MVGGLVGSVIAIVLAWFICGYPSMWARRSEILSAMESNGGTLAEGEWLGDLPPISWSILCDNEHMATREAILSDIRGMAPSEGPFGIFSWPALPYMIGTGHTSDCDELIKVVDGIYSDYPELSVYTNGQCIQAVAAVARYALPESSESNADENRAELSEVTQRLDEIADKCGTVAKDSDFIYVFEAYKQVAENCVYANGDSEGPHENDIYGAIIDGRSRCYGGAAALKALLDRRGIPSFMASGVIHGDPSLRHAWNIIWYDDKWYACDVTSAMGCDSEKDSSFYGSCMMELADYTESHDVIIDEGDKELMKAYEESLSSLDAETTDL